MTSAVTDSRTADTRTHDPREGVAHALALYRDLHRYPELSGAEARTATTIGTRLTSAGLDVTAGIGGHGVVGVLVNGAGPVVMLRAELDALPLLEQTGLPYASTATGLRDDGQPTPVMHACGHDLHLAAMVGAASALAGHRAAWRGTLLVVGQPAEETLQGAQAMLADGLYERFGRPDVVLAQHAVPLPAGIVAHGRGPMLAGSVSLRLTVQGRGGHAAATHLCADPLPVAASIVVALQTLASKIGPGAPAAVTVGCLRAGEAANVVADRATMDVTVRAMSEDTVARLVADVGRTARGLCAAAGNGIHPEIQELGRSPVMHPEPHTSARVHRVHERVFGTDRVAWWPPSLATEDFAHYARDGVATAYWMLGVVGPREWADAPGATIAQKLAALPSNHSARFRPDATIAVPAGITALVSAARAVLEDGEPAATRVTPSLGSMDTAPAGSCIMTYDCRDHGPVADAAGPAPDTGAQR